MGTMSDGLLAGLLLTAGWILVAVAQALRDHDAIVWILNGIPYPRHR